MGFLAYYALTLLPGIVCVLGEPLLLTPLIQSGQVAKARTLSKISPVQGKNLGYSGFLTVLSKSKKRKNNIFFWLQPCTKGCDPGADPFVLWFQGGPGGPGTFGALTEIGNWFVDSKLELKDHAYSWCLHRNCLFIDQPVQTGFSFQTDMAGHYDPKAIEYTSTSPEAMEQVWEVLQQFFTVYPEYKPAPFYITGESYGGLYTANMGYTIWKHNQRGHTSEHINFVGLSVGDPMINMGYQMPTYASTLYGMGVIMKDEAAQIAGIMAKSVAALHRGDCPEAFKQWNSVWNDDGGGGDPGLYWKMTGLSMTENVLLTGPPAGFDHWVEFLNKSDVKTAMHFSGTPSQSSAEGGEVYHAMVNSGDWCANSSWIYATLFMELGIDLMIYSSTSDPLLGPPTTEAGIDAVFDYAARSSHAGADAKAKFLSTKKKIWKVAKTDDQVAGYAKCFVMDTKHHNRFCYTVIRNAGHETPAFQPRASFDMTRRFIEGASFGPDGNNATVPTVPECGGEPPFTGAALPACYPDN